MARGVAMSHIAAAIATVFGDEDLTGVAAALLDGRRTALRREADPRRRARKAVAYLVRRGYPYGVALAAWRHIEQDLDEES